MIITKEAEASLNSAWKQMDSIIGIFSLWVIIMVCGYLTNKDYLPREALLNQTSKHLKNLFPEKQ